MSRAIKLSALFILASPFLGCISSSDGKLSFASSVSSSSTTTTTVNPFPNVNRYGNGKVIESYIHAVDLDNPSIRDLNVESRPLLGKINVAAVLVNFSDFASPQSLTADQLHQTMFTGLPAQFNNFSLKNWFENAAQGAISIGGEVYTSTLDSSLVIDPATHCPFSHIEQYTGQIKSAARVATSTSNVAIGSSLSSNSAKYDADFTVYYYFWPYMPGCTCGETQGSSGLAMIKDFGEGWLNNARNIPSAPDRQSSGSPKVNENYSEYGLLHEFGHAIGMGHNDTYNCKNSSGNNVPGFVNQCQRDEYGDSNSIMAMGNGLLLGFTGSTAADFGVPGPYYLDRMGWRSSTLATANNGTYELYPLDKPKVSGKSQILKIARDIIAPDPGVENAPTVNLNYFRIYRKTNRVALNRSGTQFAPDGIQIEIGGKQLAPGTIKTKVEGPELFFGPKSQENIYDVTNQYLLVGESFTDIMSGITITLNSIDTSTYASGVARVTISKGVAPAPLPPTGLKAEPNGPNSVVVSYHPGTDANGNQLWGTRFIVDNDPSRIVPYVSCQTRNSEQGYECYPQNYCETGQFLFDGLAGGMTHTITMQSVGVDGRLSAPVSYQVATPPGGAEPFPSSVKNIRMVSAQAQPLPNQPVSATNFGKINLTWDAANEDNHRAIYAVALTPLADNPLNATYSAEVYQGTLPRSGVDYVSTLVPAEYTVTNLFNPSNWMNELMTYKKKWGGQALPIVSGMSFSVQVRAYTVDFPNGSSSPRYHFESEHWPPVENHPITITIP